MEHSSPAGIRGILNKPFTLGKALAWLGVLLALLVLGAHYFRAGNHVLTVCLTGIVALHCGGAAWKRYAVAAFLIWGVLEWGMSVHALIGLRMHMGAPWLRGAAILSAVALLTALAAAHTLAAAGKSRMAAPQEAVFTRTTAFVLAFAVLYAMRDGRPDVLLLERFFPAVGSIQIVLLAWYAAIVAGNLASRRTSRKARRTAWLTFSAVFFGQLVLGLAGVPGMRTLASAHIPVPGLIIFAPVYRGEIGFMPFLVLTATVLAGGAWCSMLCYFGSAEALACAGKSVKNSSRLLALALRYSRIAVLVLGAGTAWIFHILAFSADVAVCFGLAFAVASLFVMGYASWKYTGMVHCTAFCPMGLVVNVLGRLSPWRVRVNQSVCDGCGACEKICTYRAIDAETRQKGGTALRCTLCRDCMAVCPKTAISLTVPFVPARVGERAFIVLVVTLHVLFITAARPL